MRRLHIHEGANAVGNFIERVDLESKTHALRGPKLVDEQLRTGVALDIFEQQSLPADSTLLIAALGDAVRDLGNLQYRVYFRADAFQFPSAVERLDPISQIVVGQNSSRDDRRLYDVPPKHIHDRAQRHGEDSGW